MKLEAKVIFLFHPTFRYMGGLRFEVIRRHSSRFWLVKERPVTDIGKYLPNMDDISETTDNQKDNEKDLPF